MRLSDLNPRWYSHGGSPDIVGITFDCPCPKCASARKASCGIADSDDRLKWFIAAGGVRLGPLFSNEIDRDGLPNDVHWGDPATKWTRTGDTFETLTLAPSADASKFGHWHGNITNGEAA